MIHHEHMASAQDLFGQLWKEYALSDSRYMTSDTLVLCMETMTVVSLRDPAKARISRPADPSPALVGTFMLWRCISDRDEALRTAPGTVDGVHEPPLRRYALLCHQSIRPLRERGGVLSTGRILFLVVLFLDELHLDCGPSMFVGPSPHANPKWLTQCIRLSFRQRQNHFGRH
jgi:hypothetical protein